MGWVVKILPIFIMLLSLSSAAIIESGDNGAQFAADKASAICKEGNVEAVYVCLGNVVKAVSSEPSYGSTFYKADGRVVRCPVVAPTDMGGECLQMMVPNYCTGQSVCGVSPQKTFPGQNGTPEQNVAPQYTPPLPVVTEPTATEPNKTVVIAPPPITPPKSSSGGPGSSGSDAVAKANSDNVPGAVPNTFDFAIDNLLLIVLGLGLVSVAVLFALFRNSLSEDEESG